MTDRTPQRASLRVLVIAVTYKSEELADRLGETLASFVGMSPSHYCATVENSNSLPTIAILAQSLQGNADQHLAIAPASNVGFAPAVNAAYAASLARWGRVDVVILLNPDVITSSQLLHELAARVRASPDVGVASGVLRDADGHVDRGTARRRWTPLTLFAEIAGFGESFAKGTRLSRYIEIGGSPVQVDITSGALLAVRAAVLQSGLDCRLPLYLEDQEICHRAHVLGYKVMVYPDLTAVHLGAASRLQNSESQRNLRCMELAAAPAMSMRDWSGVPFGASRAIIGLAACARILAAGTAQVSAKRRQWGRRQVVLGRWLLGWALDPGGWGRSL
jgi:N-acetylglucosaminyl-diphospho-decaprenol L-rhamnosyltransferase